MKYHNGLVLFSFKSVLKSYNYITLFHFLVLPTPSALFFRCFDELMECFHLSPGYFMNKKFRSSHCGYLLNASVYQNTGILNK